MAIDYNGDFGVWVHSVRPASPYTTLVCTMGCALLHVLRRHGHETLAIGALSSSPSQPQAATVGVPRGDLLVEGISKGELWFPTAAGDLSEFDNALDAKRMRVTVTIVAGGGLTSLQDWCEAFGGAFETVPVRP